MAPAHLVLGILLVPLMGLDRAQGFCPALCRCSLEILNCSRITNPPGFDRVPLPEQEAHPCPFTYLDFASNAIASIGKEAWDAYPWAEYLILKDNRLSRLRHSSLEGLFSLIYLDLSCNKIHIIERGAFDAVPFLQIINLRGNAIERIPEGTFQTWHGLQFLLMVDLSRNPLTDLQDPHFYRLPLLKLLDLGATEVTPTILEGLLQTSLGLRTLILPQKMSCCLCHVKEDLEALCETIQLECAAPCDLDTALCDTEPLDTMRVVKALEARKRSSSSFLNILPGRAVSHHDVPERAGPENGTLVLAVSHHNTPERPGPENGIPALAVSHHNTPERPEPENDTLGLPPNYSHLAANLNLLKSVKHLIQTKAKEPLDMKWASKKKLKKLYLLTTLLQVALKTLAKRDEVRLEAAAPSELSDHISEEPTDEAGERPAETSLENERRVRQVTREDWLGRSPRQIDTRFGLGGDARQVAKTTTRSVDEPSVFVLPNQAELWRKLGEGREPQPTLSLLTSRPVALQPTQKPPVSDSSTQALKPTGYVVMGKDGSGLTHLSHGRNSVAVLRKRPGAKILTKEELLSALLRASDLLTGEGNLEASASDSALSLNKLPPDIMSPEGTYEEHQETSASPPLGFLLPEVHSIQAELLERQLNQKLTSLFPNPPVRKLIAHVIRILKMDCAAPMLQVACAKLVSRTGLLMKFLSKNVNEISSLWKPSFGPPENAADVSEASSRELGKPSDKPMRQGISAYRFGDKLLLGISVIVLILIIITVIGLVVICSRRSVAKDRSFLGQRKKPVPDEVRPRTPSLDNQPLWLKDMYYKVDEGQRDTMVNKLREESFEKKDTAGKGQARPSVPESGVEKLSSATTRELLVSVISPTPSAPPPSSQRPSGGKSWDKTEGSSEGPSLRATSWAIEEEEGTSATPSTPEAISEVPESGEEGEDAESD